VGVQPFDMGRAFSYGWTKFQQNVGPLILVELVAFVGSIIAFIITEVIRSSLSGGLIGLLLVSAITQILIWIITTFLAIGLYRAALAVTAGQSFTVGGVFSTENIGPYMIGAVIYGVMVGVGTLFCIIPGIVLAFFGFFWPYYVLDQQQDAVTAIKSSFTLVNANMGQMIPFAIVAFLVYVVGFVACGVGVLVTAPIALLAIAFAYRTLNNQPVAP
jgi:hypothetical protein